jgi:hypothetical protein
VAELDESTYERVKRFAVAGDELVAAGEFRAAIREYNEAWGLLPEPKSDWNAATWILAAIADAAFLGGFIRTAREALDFVMVCPDAVGNPFLHLRRGEVLFEQQDFGAAADELMRAYMGGGLEIFEQEHDKYLEFLRTRAVLP